MRTPEAGGGSAGSEGPIFSDPTGSQDRCLGAVCETPALPPQPDVPFLGDAGDGWLRLIEADWALGPQTEGYRCIRQTMTRDVYVTAFAPLVPTGTHHTVLEVHRSSVEPDGVTVCGVTAGGERRLQGAGAGTQPTPLPDGVAMKIGAGEQLLMNLHLFNATNDVLRGTSGMRIKVAAQEQVKYEAEVRLMGPLTLQIPRGQVTQGGSCKFGSPATVFSVAPHMHQLGVHAKVVAHSSIGGDRVLLDMPYEFTHQLVYPIAPVQLAAGDSISVECTYLNTTDRTVSWGDSTLSEMCFASVGAYPSTNSDGMPCWN
jgi:hypothetical protein